MIRRAYLVEVIVSHPADADTDALDALMSDIIDASTARDAVAEAIPEDIELLNLYLAVAGSTPMLPPDDRP